MAEGSTAPFYSAFWKILPALPETLLDLVSWLRPLSAGIRAGQQGPQDRGAENERAAEQRESTGGLAEQQVNPARVEERLQNGEQHRFEGLDPAGRNPVEIRGHNAINSVELVLCPRNALRC